MLSAILPGRADAPAHKSCGRARAAAMLSPVGGLFSAAGWLKSLTVLAVATVIPACTRQLTRWQTGHADVSQDSTDLAVRARAVTHACRSS